MMSACRPSDFEGLAVNTSCVQLNACDREEVDDDLQCELETRCAVQDDLDAEDVEHIAGVFHTLSEASKGVLEKTDSSYKQSVLISCLIICAKHCSRLMKGCEEFLLRMGFIQKPGVFFTRPDKHAPQYITAWIMDACVFSSLSR